jgi:D-3-phosphoglycerate dehydrogenase
VFNRIIIEGEKMIRILAADGIEASAAKTLKDAGYELAEQFYDSDALGSALADFDVLVTRSATKVRVPQIDAAVKAGRLKLIIRAGVGLDTIDVDYARGKGIAVTNTPAASSRSVAENAVAHMFALATHLYIANVTMREGKWEKKKYMNCELAGKTLGLIGFGKIGRCTADIASAIGMKVIYTNKTGPKPENEPYAYVKLDELLAKSDFISLHMPKSDKPVLDAAAFAKVKPTAFVVNTARGALIDDAALIAALDAGKLAGAGLDVFVEEPAKNAALYTHPKISLTPHLGGQTAEAQERIGAEVASIIIKKFGAGKH